MRLGAGKTSRSRDDLVEIFERRTMRALALIADRLPRERLLAALSAPTDTDVLFEALRDTAAVGADLGQERDPLTEAFLRGASMKREMLKAEGGVLSARELATHLGITPQGLGRKRLRNQLFWLDVGEGFVYPAFQVSERGLVAGIREVLEAFRVEDSWMRVHFMLTQDPRLEGRRPIDLLREGRIEEVVKAAAAYGEQGAA